VTRILKTYGDSLEESPGRGGRPSEGVTKRHQCVLRCLALLIRLVGRRMPRYLPQVMVLLSSCVRPEVPPRPPFQPPPPPMPVLP